MHPRTELQTILEGLLGSRHVYFQQPSTTQMVYPCIVYGRSSANTSFADNQPYTYEKRYIVTVIDKNPDSLIPDKVARLPKCVFDRHYTADNLNHDVFTLFF
jgi:hypothetical protein